MNDFDAQAALLNDGRQLHLQHGPIDLVIEAYGEVSQIKRAYQLAAARFQTVLNELVEELPLLRKPVSNSSPEPKGQIASNMYQAVLPYAPNFITPMAAVAGSVADEILKTVRQVQDLTKIYVNNGGDIALYLAPDGTNEFNIGVVGNPDTGKLITKAKITAGSKIGGIATSGWRGRSHSLGIADCVTVFAKSAALADAAATMIANKINLHGCSAITREPASQLSPDSDLGDQFVTTGVDGLTINEITTALNVGHKAAEKWFAAGLFNAAFLSLNDQQHIIGWRTDLKNKNTPNSQIPVTKYRSIHA